jgi:hypothetical protein
MRHILFITLQNESLTFGLPYAIQLARIRSEDLITLILSTGNGSGAPHVDNGLLSSHSVEDSIFTNNSKFIQWQCAVSGIHSAIEPGGKDFLMTVQRIIRKNTGIDIVILGPGVLRTQDNAETELLSLIKAASIPVVSMKPRQAKGKKEIIPILKGGV